MKGVGVRIRRQPYIETGNVITTVPDGAILPLMGDANGWTYVRYDEGHTYHLGYIRNDLLEFGGDYVD